MFRRVLVFLFSTSALLAFSQSKIRIACVGNSITEGKNIEAGKRYPDRLQQLLGNAYDVRNYGLGGRTLLRQGDYPYWNEQKYEEVLEWDPDIVIIKLGTNDTKPQNWKYKDEFIADYREFVQSFKKLPSHPKIYICYPIPVFKDNYGIRESVVSGEMIPMIKKIARAEHVKIIDLYKPMTGNGSMVPDGVHPDAAGATIMAETVYHFIYQK
jgi:acyl-CoA thioesterase I